MVLITFVKLLSTLLWVLLLARVVISWTNPTDPGFSSGDRVRVQSGRLMRM